MSYNFQNGDVIGLDTEAGQSNKQIRGGEDVLTPTTLSAVPVYFRTGYHE